MTFRKKLIIPNPKPAQIASFYLHLAIYYTVTYWFHTQTKTSRPLLREAYRELW